MLRHSVEHNSFLSNIATAREHTGLGDTLTPITELLEHCCFRFYGGPTAARKSWCNTDDGRCTHQKDELLPWTPVCCHWTSHAQTLTCQCMTLSQSHQDFSDSPQVRPWWLSPEVTSSTRIHLPTPPPCSPYRLSPKTSSFQLLLVQDRKLKKAK